MSKKRVFLFGGAFDPPHNGHVTMITSVLQQDLADEVWIIPVGVHAFNKEMSAAHHRLQMCFQLKNYIRAEYPEFQGRVKVDGHEIMSGGVSYTFETLEALATRHPENTFSWMIGSDIGVEFLLWHQADKILEKYQVYVYPRKGFPISQMPDDLIKIYNVPEVPITSTLIRERIQQGKPIDDLVPSVIAEYSKQNYLYI